MSMNTFPSCGCGMENRTEQQRTMIFSKQKTEIQREEERSLSSHPNQKGKSKLSTVLDSKHHPTPPRHLVRKARKAFPVSTRANPFHVLLHLIVCAILVWFLGEVSMLHKGR